jgi:alpha-methylacyl-CoA racemase
LTGPLAGTAIVEIAALGAVPFAGMVLSDLGADVVRVDRVLAGSAQGRPYSPMDRGRRSIGVDLKLPAGRQVVLDLLRQADGIMEGYRPGVMEKLRLGPQDVLAAHPRIVYGRMTGWGQTGPLARTAGHDINYVALSGPLGHIGSAGRPPDVPLNLIGDMGGGGMLLAVGMLGCSPPDAPGRARLSTPRW